MLHVSCMVWGIGGLLLPLPAGSMCAYSLYFPAVAAQVWAGQSLGTRVTLLALCPPWLGLFVPQTGSCCAWEIPSPLPPCPSAASPWHLPALGVGTASPWGWDWEQEGQAQQQVWLGGSLTASPLPRKHTHMQSGEEPEHPSGTCFPSSPKAAFLEHVCLSVLILPAQHPHSLCLHELFLC